MSEEPRDPAKDEGTINLIKKALNGNQIKLWLPPYVSEDGSPVEEQLLELAENLAPTLDLPYMIVLNGVRDLQQNAMEKLLAREVLKSTGKISLKIKLSRQIKTLDNPLTSLEMDRYTKGSELTERISEHLKMDPCNLRLISGGRVIKDNESLNEQNLKPGAVIMVVQINKDDDSLKVFAEQQKILEDTRNDAEILGGNNDDGAPSLQIADQSGKSLDLPTEERKALIIAMSLHEKGRTALKKKDFALALVFLLEADKEYTICRSELLNRVDNYALLNLDIAWCYLKLEHISELPEAEKRLTECEMRLKQSYGENLERLQAVKGSTDTEAVLFVRLHLMQGIIAYHMGERARANNLLNRAEAEMRDLDVPEESIQELIANGYSEREARLGLRVCKGNIPAAANHIQQRREEKKRIAKEEREERKRKAERRRLGKTADGNWVNLGYYKTLCGMGFNSSLAAAALRQSNNDMTASIDLLQNQPDVLEAAVFDFNESRPEGSLTDEVIAEVTNLGFDVEATRKALRKFKGNIEAAVEALLKQEELSDDDEEEDRVASSASKKRREEAYGRMQEGISDLGAEDDHLDITLEEEAVYLAKYKGFMEGK